MVTTTVHLTDEQAKALEALSAKSGKSVDQLIQQSLQSLLRVSDAENVDLEEKRRRAISLAGRFRSGLSDLSEEHDHYLEEAYAA